MRIVIDLQGAQSESRFRGIGRYSLSFAKAVARLGGAHDVIIALNGLLPQTIDAIRDEFKGLLPKENVVVWSVPGPIHAADRDNVARISQACLIREAFLAAFQPDIVHVSSIFEGYYDDAVASIGRLQYQPPTSVSLYDLIPLLNSDSYLSTLPTYRQFYEEKLSDFKRANLFLSISEWSRHEAIQALSIPHEKIVNVSAAIEPIFRPLTPNTIKIGEFCKRIGIRKSFLLYTGGSDQRKNLFRLVEAFARQSAHIRHSHQLVFAGQLATETRAALNELATRLGLANEDLIFTGFVTEDELVLLYNICTLFIFPSWHEGFGLPVLEAMACGTPVIASNNSSIPEVVDRRELLFDPFDVNDIAQKIDYGLNDLRSRSALKSYGLERAKAFSWDLTAKKALGAWEALAAAHQKATISVDAIFDDARTQLVEVARFAHESDLCGSANALAENRRNFPDRQLFVDVSELSQRDAKTGIQRVVRGYLRQLLENPPQGFRVRPVYAVGVGPYRFANIFLQRFTKPAHETEAVPDPLMQWQIGDVFFGLDMQHDVQTQQGDFYQRLRRDGVVVKYLVYDLLPIEFPDLFHHPQMKSLHEAWLRMIALTDGAICISKATAEAFEIWIKQNCPPQSPEFRIDWVHIGSEIEEATSSVGIPEGSERVLSEIRSRLTFLCVATLEPRKAQVQILDAFEALWTSGVDVNLILVGKQGWQADGLVERIRQHQESGRRLHWLEGISDEFLGTIYKESTCLIAASLNEGFGLPLVEAARHGLPILARNISVFVEVARNAASYFEGESGKSLAGAIESWIQAYRSNSHVRSDGVGGLSWSESARQLKTKLVQPLPPRSQLLIDVSELVKVDAKSGIQRVVWNVLNHWYKDPPAEFALRPVYVDASGDYRYARQFVANCGWAVASALQDDPIQFAAGDIFFALDFAPVDQAAKKNFYRLMRTKGVAVHFLVYDLLPIQFPEYFPSGTSQMFEAWLEAAREAEVIVTISHAVSAELRDYYLRRFENGKLPRIVVNYLGSKLETHDQDKPFSVRAPLKDKVYREKCFLVVGTVEPRKGHSQILDTFDQLRDEGEVFNLIIVGKKGWMVEGLVDRIVSHRDYGQSLFWLDDVDDRELCSLYRSCTCLIAASHGEGFGLPLVEAMSFRLPIIARDIPVFREIAGDYPSYFTGTTGADLAPYMKERLGTSRVMTDQGILLVDWPTSAKNLLMLLCRDAEP